jgi:enterochelin esterase family protein
MLSNNERLHDVLKAKGNAVTYAEYNGGHDHVNWRVSVGRGLMALLETANRAVCDGGSNENAK